MLWVLITYWFQYFFAGISTFSWSPPVFSPVSFVYNFVQSSCNKSTVVIFLPKDKVLFTHWRLFQSKQNRQREERFCYGSDCTFYSLDLLRSLDFLMKASFWNICWFVFCDNFPLPFSAFMRDNLQAVGVRLILLDTTFSFACSTKRIAYTLGICLSQFLLTTDVWYWATGTKKDEKCFLIKITEQTK